tara:strand:+ start:1929 stop:2264 length:336 start_codon:yes stop_codon:yes gene_type:complete
MAVINTFILWSWLLGISLLVPTALPAGGAQKSIIQKRENSIRSPLIAFKEFNLLSTVNNKSSIITRVESGTPVDVLKVWQAPQSGTWLLVSVLSQSSNQIFSKRGWVYIGS